MRSIRNAAHGAYVLSDGEAEDVGALALAADEYLRAIQQARGEVVQLLSDVGQLVEQRAVLH